MNTRLDDVNELLKLKKGDQGRLEHIKKALEKGTILFVSDSKYLKTLTVQYLINDTEKQDIKHNYESPAQTTKPKDIPTPKIEQPSENVNEAEPQKIESDKISFCGNCGNNMGSNSFCSKCGQSHTSSKLNSYCGNCGSQTLEPTHFCANCRVSKTNYLQTTGLSNYQYSSSIPKKSSVWTIALIGLILFGGSLVGSWVTVQVYVVSVSFTLADMYYTIFSLLDFVGGIEDTIPDLDKTPSLPINDNMVSQFTDLDNAPARIISGVISMMITIVFYPIVLTLGIISILKNKKRLLFVTGIGGILISILWIYGILTLKSVMLEQLAPLFNIPMFGGMIAQIAEMVVSGINIGYGVIFAIVGSVLMMYILKK